MPFMWDPEDTGQATPGVSSPVRYIFQQGSLTNWGCVDTDISKIICSVHNLVEIFLRRYNRIMLVYALNITTFNDSLYYL